MFTMNEKWANKYYQFRSIQKTNFSWFWLSLEKNKNEFIEKNKSLDIDFDQNLYSETALGFSRVGHNSVQLMKWMAVYDK